MIAITRLVAILGLLIMFTSCQGHSETDQNGADVKINQSDLTLLYSNNGFQYEAPVADFTQAATQLVALSPEGLAIGEAHGQLAGVMLLEAVVKAALKTHETVVILSEFTPQEAGIAIAELPIDNFQTFKITDDSWPFWHENVDKRATHELKAYFLKITQNEAVELSYLWDLRLQVPPKNLKAHGLGERWVIARQYRPKAYFVSLLGNYHTEVHYNYPLDVTNSLCRYLDEKYNTRPICIAVSRNVASKNKDCPEKEEALVLEGHAVNEDWDYVVSRPSGCHLAAHWVKDIGP